MNAIRSVVNKINERFLTTARGTIQIFNPLHRLLTTERIMHKMKDTIIEQVGTETPESTDSDLSDEALDRSRKVEACGSTIA